MSPSGPRGPIARATPGKLASLPFLSFTLLAQRSAFRKVVGVEKERNGFGDFRGFENLHLGPRWEAASPCAQRAASAAQGPSWAAEPLQGRQRSLGHAQSTTEFAQASLQCPWRGAGLYRAHLQGRQPEHSKLSVKSLPATQAAETNKLLQDNPSPASHSSQLHGKPRGDCSSRRVTSAWGKIINLLFPFINQAPHGRGP